jgi:AcrR family transcriptional regulator
MGRSRKLDREALLDAAQEVVSRDGASNLTIEAVAANAGVGKATVL